MATPNVFTESQEKNQQSVLTAVASADPPVFGEEKAVPLSVTLGGSLRVGGSGAADLGKVEDAPHVSGDTGVMLLGVRTGGSTSFVDTTGDYTPVAINSVGHMYTTDTKATDQGSSSASTLRVVIAEDNRGSHNPKSNALVVSTTSAVAIGAASANAIRLHAIHIYPALTGTCVIAGFSDGSAAQNYTFPAASTGTFQFWGAVNSAGACTVTCSNAADDNKVMVMWSANV